MGTRAAIYCRVSTAGQETEGTSLTSQEAQCRTHAEALGYQVAEGHVYREVHTGGELWQRPKLTALRQVRAGEVQAIVAHSLDRLWRKQTHTAILVDECEHAGAALLFVAEEFEMSAVGDFIRSAQAFAAELEREKIRERMQRGLRSRIESGKPLPGGRPLFGYRWRDKAKSGLVVDEATAPIVRRIFDQAATGTSLRRIAAELTAEGIPTPTGQEGWKQSTIHAIVIHRGYAGAAEALRYATERAAGGGRHIAQREVDQRVALPAGTIPPLVDAETFAEVGRRLARNKAESSGRLRDPEAFLLRGGYVRCGYCGNAIGTVWMTRHRREGEPKRFAMYNLTNTCDSHRTCRTVSILAATLDAAVWARVEAVLTQPGIIAAEVARMRADDPAGADLAATDRAIAEIERKRGNLSRRLALIDDDEAAAPVVAEINALGKQLRDLQGERGVIRRRWEGWQATQDRLADLERWCERVAARLGELTYEQKRLALEALGVRVRLYRRGETPRYEIGANIPLGSPEGEVEAPTTRAGSV